ncbi:MAG: NifU family protein [Candidatus Lokiarchaeota archaeon]|nr:NifU family protein [Candidatus Lokiarchaeota archaeon]
MDKEKIKQVIDKIRPQLQMDGGDCEIVDITDEGVVKVRLLGHCAGCPYSQQTVKMGIERALKQFVPEVKEVVSVPY